MAIINTLIPKQNFDLIAERIGAIITDELSNQYSLSDPKEEILNANVYLERWVPFGDEEKAIVNIMHSSSDFENEDITQTDGENKYFIDVYATGKHKGDDRGDSLALANLKRLLGVIRAILMHTKYHRLGFDDPQIVNKRVVKSLSISEPQETRDSSYSMNGRLIFVVNAIETELQSDPVPLGDLETKAFVKTLETENGFQYLIEQS